MISFNIDNTNNFSDSSMNPFRENLSASQPALDRLADSTEARSLNESRLSIGGQKFLSPVKNRTMKEYEQLLSDLKKENFDLKMRVYYLELKVKEKFPTEQDLHKVNIELRVRNEGLAQDLQDKHALLEEASVAVFQLDDSEKKVKELEAKLTEVLSTQQQHENKSSQDVEVRDAEIEKLVNELATLESNLLSSKQANDDSTKTYDAKMEELSRQKASQIENMTNQLANLHAELVTCRQSYDYLVDDLEKERNDFEVQKNQMGEEKTAASEKIVALENQLSDSKQTLESALEDQKVTDVESLAEIEKLSKQIADLQIELSDNKKFTDDLVETRQKEQLDFESEIEQLQTQNTAELDTLSEKVSQLESELSESKRTLDEARNEFKIKEQEFEAKLKDISNQNASEVDTRVEDLSRQVADLQGELTESKKTIDDLVEKSEEDRQEFDSWKTQLEDQKAGELKLASERLSSVEQKLVESGGALSEALQNKEAARLNFNKVSTEKDSEIENLSLQLAELQERMEEHNTVVANLNDELTEKQERFDSEKASLEKSFQIKTEDLSLEVQKRNKAIKGLTEVVQSEKEKSDKLMHDLKTANQELADLHSVLDKEKVDIDLQTTLDRAVSLDDISSKTVPSLGHAHKLSKSHIPVIQSRSSTAAGKKKESEDSLTSKCNQLTDEVDFLKKESELLLEEKTLFERERKDLKESLDKLESDYKELLEASSTLKSEEKLLKEKIDSLVEEQMQLLDTNKKLVNDKDELDKKLNALEAAKNKSDELKQNLEEHVQQLKDQHQEMLDQQEQLDSVTDSLQPEDIIQARSELKDSFENLDSDYKNLLEAFKSLTQENTDLVREVADLSNQRDALKSSNQELLASVDTLAASNERLGIQMSEMEPRSARLSDEDHTASELRKQNDDLVSELETLVAEKDRLQTTMIAKDTHCSTLEEELNRRCQDLLNMQSQVQLANDYVERLKNEIQSNESRRMTLETSFQMNRDELGFLKTQLESTNSQLFGINESLRNMSFTEERRQSGEFNLEEHLLEIRALRQKLEAAIDHNEELREKLEEQLNMNQMAIAEEKEAQLQHTVEENRVLAQGLKELRDITNTLKLELDEKTEEKNQWNSKEEHMKHQLSESREHLVALRDSLAELRQKLSEKEQSVENLNSLLRGSEAQVNSLNSCNAVLEKDLKSVREEQKSHDASVQKLKLHLTDRDEKIVHLERKLEKEVTRCDQGRSRILQLEVEVEHMKGDQIELSRLKDAFSSYDKVVDSLREEIRSKTDDLDQRSAQLSQSREESSKLSQELAILREKVDDLERENRHLVETENTLISRNELITQLEAELDTKTERIENIINESELYRENAEVLRIAVSKLETELRHLSEEADEARRSVSAHDDVISNLRSELQEKTNNLGTASKFVEELSRQLKDMSLQQRENEESISVLRDALLSRDEFVRERENELSLRDEKIRSLESELKALRDSTTSLQGTVDKYENYGNEFKQMLKSQNNKIDQLESELQSKTDCLEKEQSLCRSLRAEIEHLKADLSSANTNVRELKELQDQVHENEELNRTLKLELSVYEAMQREQGSHDSNEIFSLLLDEIRHLRIQLERCIDANNSLRVKLEANLAQQNSIRRDLLSAGSSPSNKYTSPRRVGTSPPQLEKTLTPLVPSKPVIGVHAHYMSSPGGSSPSEAVALPTEDHRDSGITESMMSMASAKKDDSADSAVRKLFSDSSAALRSLLQSPPSYAMQPSLSKTSDEQFPLCEPSLTHSHSVAYDDAAPSTSVAAASQSFPKSNEFHVAVCPSASTSRTTMSSLSPPRFTDITNLRFAAPQEFHQLHPELLTTHPERPDVPVTEPERVVSNSNSTSSNTAQCSVDDLSSLKSKVADCLAVLSGIRARLTERLKSFDGSPIKDMEYSTLKQLLSSIDDINASLEIQRDTLLTKFTTGDNQETITLRKKYKSALRALDQARKRLQGANQRKENAKEDLIERLTRTQEVLQKARCNLETQAVSCGLHPDEKQD